VGFGSGRAVWRSPNFESIDERRIELPQVASVTAKINLEIFCPEMNDCSLERCVVANFDGERCSTTKAL
jgi:hypothetical protein